MTDPMSRAAQPAPVSPTPSTAAGAPKAPPQRPPLANPNAAPVLAKLTPPFSVRVAELFWILSFFVGGFGIVYYFIIRKEQLPLISDIVRGVEDARNEQTYTTAADIIFWSVFGVLVGVLLIQVTLLVSFMARRPQMRWWQLLTWVVQVVTLGLSLELALTGERAAPLRLILAAQCGMVLLALLASVMPKALAWSARKHDVVRHQQGSVSAE